jgi:hypothetical protein
MQEIRKLLRQICVLNNWRKRKCFVLWQCNKVSHCKKQAMERVIIGPNG